MGFGGCEYNFRTILDRLFSHFLVQPHSTARDEGGKSLGSCLAGEVLWDEDWMDSESLMDADPRAGRAVKELLGIDEDYYIAVPPDPTEEEMKGVWVTLRGLTKGGS